jgi:type II secretory pathway predicted ATPase ExeA
MPRVAVVDTAFVDSAHSGGPAPGTVQELAKAAFGETANPDDYVARPATERVLQKLEEAVFGAGVPAALIAPPGMGKSMLLRVFAARARARTRVAELAYGSLDFEGLCEWALGLLGMQVNRVDGLSSEGLARAARKQDITLIIDDACSLPVATARQLAELVRNGSPGLRLVVAAPDGYAASRVLAALGSPLEELRLVEPMNREEALAYMRQRLARSKAPSGVRQLLSSGALSRVLRLSGGVPRRVHSIVHEVVVDLPADVRAGWRDEDWLGAPLDELGSLGLDDEVRQLVDENAA